MSIIKKIREKVFHAVSYFGAVLMVSKIISFHIFHICEVIHDTYCTVWIKTPDTCYNTHIQPQLSEASFVSSLSFLEPEIIAHKVIGSL